jgi:hypothetical protein
VPTVPGIDYLGQVLADSEGAIPGAIAYRELAGAGDAAYGSGEDAQ